MMHQAHCPDCQGRGQIINKAASRLPLILIFWPVLKALKDNCQRCGGTRIIIGSDSLPKQVDIRV